MIHRSIKDRKDVFQPNVAIFEVERLYLMMACIQTDFNRGTDCRVPKAMDN